MKHLINFTFYHSASPVYNNENIDLYTHMLPFVYLKYVQCWINYLMVAKALADLGGIRRRVNTHKECVTYMNSYLKSLLLPVFFWYQLLMNFYFEL